MVTLLKDNHDEGEQLVALLVEDCAADARLFQTAIRMCSKEYSVTWQQTVEDSVRWLQRQDRDVLNRLTIFTDLHLGAGLSGFDLVSQLKLEPRWSALPVVVVSGSEHPGDEEILLASGVTAFIGKQSDFHDFEEKLKTSEGFWLKRSSDVIKVVCGGGPVETAYSDCGRS